MKPLPLFILAGCLAIAAATSFASAADPVTIKNQWLQVTVDPAAGIFSVAPTAGATRFLTDGKLDDAGGTIEVGKAEFPQVQIVFPDGNRDQLTLMPDPPFLLLQSTRHNSTGAEVGIDSLKLFASTLNLQKTPADLAVLNTAGLTRGDKNVGGYEWIAVADPQTRHGVVAGWLTHDRSCGALFCQSDLQHLSIQPQLDYGRLRIAPGQDAQSEILAIGYFDDARLGLEAFADAIAKQYNIKLHPKPVGYCTWYSDKHGGSSDQKSLAELAAFASRELGPYGLSVIQIDDGWQRGIKSNGPKKVFADFNPAGPYSDGMKATADNLIKLGFTPGVWFMPFAGTWDDPFFKDHQDWFAKTADGKPFVSKWGGTSLDMTQAGARQYLSDEVHRITQDWGFGYLKMDGLYTGVATRQVYVNSSYKDDQLGEATLSNPDKTNIEAYRDGLKLVRQAAGDKVFLLGCCTPQNMRSYGGAFGLVDAMRVGPDNGPKWSSLLRGPTFASRSYFLNGRVWWNDPDPIYVRASVPIEHARLICSWVTLAGDLTFCSDWLPDLPAERLDLLRRTMPSHDLPSRPLDLFENEPPRIWLLSDDRHDPRRDVIGLFNWTSQPLGLSCPLEKLGLDPKSRYVAFDYWANAFVPEFESELKSTLPPESCQVLAIRPAADHPQLISTSRHITQGIVDVVEEKWDAGSRMLSGRSRVVANDPYELRIVCPSSGWKIERAEVSSEDTKAGVTVEVKQSGKTARVKINSATSREVGWAVRF